MKTTKNYAYDYYKNIVDVNVNWLEFLNSHSKFLNVNFLELAPKLEEIREKLYNSFKNSKLTNKDIFFVNGEVKVMIAYLLKKIGYSDLQEYIYYGLDEKEKNDLSIALYIKRSIQSKMEDIEVLDYSLSKENPLLKDALKRLKNIELSTTLSSDIDFTEYYLNSLGIKESDNSLIGYIYFNLIIIKNIFILMNTEQSINYVPCVDELIEEILNKGIITNINNLVKVFEVFEQELANLMQKNCKNKVPTLQQNVKRNN